MSDLRPIQDFEDKSFNPFVADEIVFGADAQPYPKLAELRRTGPVHEFNFFEEFGKGGNTSEAEAFSTKRFLVVSYDEAKEVLQNPKIYSNKSYNFTLGLTFGQTLTGMDPPLHGRYRLLFQQAFLPGRVAQWGQKVVDPVVSELVDAFEQRGSVDLVNEFTIHYPFRVIYRMLEMPERDVATFHRLAMAQTLFFPDIVPYAIEAGEKLGVYFQSMIEARRKNPGDDLVSVLAAANVDGEHIPDEVLIAFLRQLMNAGGDTTYRATSIMLMELLQDPEQFEAVSTDRSLLENAIEEAVRFDTPAAHLARVATVDTELAGVKIPANSFVDVSIGAANRDPSKFPDPEKYNVFRNPTTRHLGFGLGPHVCVGQYLARLEMQRAMTALLDRLPNLRLDTSKPPPVAKGNMMRVPRYIYARFG